MWLDQFDGLLELTLDHEQQQAVIVDAIHGEVRRALEPTGLPSLLDFKRETIRVPERTLILLTSAGETLEVELYWCDDQPTRRAGRPAIYLDQNKWVQISRAINRPDQVQPTAELDATLQLVSLARRRSVLLPLSSGHYIETGPLYDRRRHDLATLMVGLSSGWIMRNPLTVRMQELVAAFRAEGDPPTREPVFTLDPAALFTGSNLPEEDQTSSLKAMSSLFGGVSARLAVLLENEAISNPPGDAYTARWAEAQQRAADMLACDSQVRAQARTFTLHAFLSDLGLHLVAACHAAGLNPHAFHDWLSASPDDDIKSLPYLGRAREVHHQRLMNAEDRWGSHDLIDWLYLSLAAGYADHVVCEKSHAHQLRRASTAVSTAGALIHTTMRDLINHLDLP